MTPPETMKPGAVALVTGASSGIGLAIAESLLADGLKVVVVARGEERLRSLCAAWPDLAHPLIADVGDAAAMENLIEALPPELRAIDVLVANAGSDLGGRRRFDEGAMADWAATVETNVIDRKSVV